jgi:hypothetical protein
MLVHAGHVHVQCRVLHARAVCAQVLGVEWLFFISLHYLLQESNNQKGFQLLSEHISYYSVYTLRYL